MSKHPLMHQQVPFLQQMLHSMDLHIVISCDDLAECYDKRGVTYLPELF